jgi:hypothetical protein
MQAVLVHRGIMMRRASTTVRVAPAHSHCQSRTTSTVESRRESRPQPRDKKKNLSSSSLSTEAAALAAGLRSSARIRDGAYPERGQSEEKRREAGRGRGEWGDDLPKWREGCPWPAMRSSGPSGRCAEQPAFDSNQRPSTPRCSALRSATRAQSRGASVAVVVYPPPRTESRNPSSSRLEEKTSSNGTLLPPPFGLTVTSSPRIPN